MYLYYKEPQNNLFKSITLHPLPFPFFILLQLCLSSIRLTHTLPKQFPISIYILIHSTFQTLHLLPFCSDIYTSFNLSFVNFHTSLFYNLISFQTASFLSTSFITSFHKTLFAFFTPPPSSSHTPLLHFLHPILFSSPQETLHILLNNGVPSVSHF